MPQWRRRTRAQFSLCPRKRPFATLPRIDAMGHWRPNASQQNWQLSRPNVRGSIALSPPAKLERTWRFIAGAFGRVGFVPFFRTKSSTKRLFNHLGCRIVSRRTVTTSPSCRRQSALYMKASHDPRCIRRGGHCNWRHFHGDIAGWN